MMRICLPEIRFWFGADGGYAFLNTLAEDRKLQSVSLKRLEESSEREIFR